MGTGINELDDIVEDGKTVASDVKAKWKIKLVGTGVLGIGVLLLKFTSDATMNKVAIGVIVVGVLMILGVNGIKWVFKQALSAGKSQPDVKL